MIKRINLNDSGLYVDCTLEKDRISFQFDGVLNKLSDKVCVIIENDIIYCAFYNKSFLKIYNNEITKIDDITNYDICVLLALSNKINDKKRINNKEDNISLDYLKCLNLLDVLNDKEFELFVRKYGYKINSNNRNEIIDNIIKEKGNSLLDNVSDKEKKLLDSLNIDDKQKYSIIIYNDLLNSVINSLNDKNVLISLSSEKRLEYFDMLNKKCNFLYTIDFNKQINKIRRSCKNLDKLLDKDSIIGVNIVNIELDNLEEKIMWLLPVLMMNKKSILRIDGINDNNKLVKILNVIDKVKNKLVESYNSLFGKDIEIMFPRIMIGNNDNINNEISNYIKNDNVNRCNLQEENYNNYEEALRIENEKFNNLVESEKISVEIDRITRYINNNSVELDNSYYRNMIKRIVELNNTNSDLSKIYIYLFEKELNINSSFKTIYYLDSVKDREDISLFEKQLVRLFKVISKQYYLDSHNIKSMLWYNGYSDNFYRRISKYE